MSEWIIGGRVPFIEGAKFEVWLANGAVRTCGRNTLRDYTTIWFDDCQHPLANAVCDSEQIKGWRLLHSAPSDSGREV